LNLSGGNVEDNVESEYVSIGRVARDRKMRGSLCNIDVNPFSIEINLQDNSGCVCDVKRRDVPRQHDA